LKNVDGFGEVPGPAGAAAGFAQDAPGLELGAAFAGGAQPAGRGDHLQQFHSCTGGRHGYWHATMVINRRAEG
jgi:hypothetical protein